MKYLKSILKHLGIVTMILPLCAFKLYLFEDVGTEKLLPLSITLWVTIIALYLCLQILLRLIFWETNTSEDEQKKIWATQRVYVLDLDDAIENHNNSGNKIKTIGFYRDNFERQEAVIVYKTNKIQP